MNPLLNLKTTIRFLRNSMSCSPLRGGLFLIALGLACFGLLPEARAVCQEGCSGSNTFLGEDALILNTGYNNTASGYQALLGNTTGYDNTATGADALASNTTAGNNVAVGSDALTFNTEGSANTATGVDALWVKLVLVTKGDRFQRQDRLAGPVHRLDCIFETR